MREPPNLFPDDILACLRDSFGIAATGIEFLPLGADAYAAVYRVETGRESYFLKTKKGSLNEASFAIPHLLRAHGIAQVVAPIATKDRRLWQRLGEFALILYPFVAGDVAARTGLSGHQWTEFGEVARAIHATILPPELRSQLPHESWVPKHGRLVRELAKRAAEGEPGSPHEGELIAFWHERFEEIEAIVARAEALGQRLEGTPRDYVLCHADIHTYNLLIDPQGRMFVIDWDEAIVAPRERDLMFVGGGVEGDRDRAREEALFFAGYGPVEIDPVALAYYRYEWVVQELGEYGAMVLTRDDVGVETQRAAACSFRDLFNPGAVVEAAYRSGRLVP